MAPGAWLNGEPGPASGLAPFAGLAADTLLPGSAALAPPGALTARRAALDFVVADFTSCAMTLAHLRASDAARRGWLLPHHRTPADLLEPQDPAAHHFVARKGGDVVAALRLLGLGKHAPPSWPSLVRGRHAEVLAQLAPAAEVSLLVGQAPAPPWASLRGLVQAAAYVALLAGRRYLLAPARPHEVALMVRLGLARTGFGAYVPSAQPHVVEIFAIDLWTALSGKDTPLRTWHHLFGDSYPALARLAQRSGLPEPAVHRPLWPWASRVLARLSGGGSGDAYR